MGGMEVGMVPRCHRRQEVWEVQVRVVRQCKVRTFLFNHFAFGAPVGRIQFGNAPPAVAPLGRERIVDLLVLNWLGTSYHPLCALIADDGFLRRIVPPVVTRTSNTSLQRVVQIRARLALATSPSTQTPPQLSRSS